MSRKITQHTVNAFMAGNSFKEDNSEVVADGSLIKMYLHGNLIAVRDTKSKSISISNAGWQTNTTKERLNGIPGVSIQQIKGNWYLNGQLWDGKLIKI